MRRKEPIIPPRGFASVTILPARSAASRKGSLAKQNGRGAWLGVAKTAKSADDASATPADLSSASIAGDLDAREHNHLSRGSSIST
jgi:hypothetical protein